MDNGKKKKSMQKPNRLILSRTLVLMAVCGIAAFAVLVWQLYKIQIIDHDLYQSNAVEQQVRETTINASRGTIYDRNMKILAMSATVNTIFISPAEMLKYNEDPSLIASGLSEILDISYDSIMQKWSDTGSWYKTIARKVEQEVSQKVREFKQEHDLKSVHVEEDTKRYYPYSSLASQVIGFVGDENRGLEGLESVYESKLHGVNGRIVRATTSDGTDMLFTRYENYYDAVDGNSLVLTIDSTIQYFLEKHLEQAIKDYAIQNGAMAIAMNVDTGAILGMTSIPDYDLNSFQTLNDEAKALLDKEQLSGDDYDRAFANALANQWRNRPVTDIYEPGSTFKIITLASAMEEGLVNENSNFSCGGSIDVIGRDKPINCWHLPGHGGQNLAECMQHSCNVAFVKIGILLGPEKFYKYAEAFGFFDKTGIDYYGEGSSFWWSEDYFFNPLHQDSLAVASFGQTFNISPIQLITAVSAVANGGYLMQPYFVQQILDAEGNVVENRAPKLVRQVISEETSRRVCEIMESVVGTSGGTGKNAYVPGYRIAGKTGTSENIGQQTDEYIVSFVGFAPADDPQIAILVLLDTPSRESGIYISGGVMAAPVVGNIFADVLPYLGVEPVFDSDTDTKYDVALPNVKTYTFEEARITLANLGFNVRRVGEGDTVIDQMPLPNVTIAAGATVVLYTDSTKSTEMVSVPNLFGMTYSDAKYTLSQNGLYIKSTGVRPSDSSTIVVARQSVAGESEVVIGTVIEVTLIDNDSSIMETRTG